MKLISHLIKKDLRRLWLPLLVWAGCWVVLCVFEFLSRHWNLPDTTGAATCVVLVFCSFFVLSLGLVAWVVQEDSPSVANVFWRTRPIAPIHLFGAKLLFIFGLLGGFPIATLALAELAALILHRVGEPPQSWMFHAAYVGLPGAVLCATLAVGAALAACTKDLSGYLCGWAMGLFVYPIVVVLRHGPSNLSDGGGVRVIFVNGAILATLSFAGLLNQYFTRRTRMTIGLLIAAVVGVGLVDWW